MAVGLQIDVKDNGAKEVAHALLSASEADFKDGLQEIGEFMHTMAFDAFEEEQSPEGVPWEQSLRAKLEGGQTLTDNAILKNSLVVNVVGYLVELSSNIVYAAIHQLGGFAGRNKSVEIEARPYLPDEDNEKLHSEALFILGERLEAALVH